MDSNSDRLDAGGKDDTHSGRDPDLVGAGLSTTSGVIKDSGKNTSAPDDGSLPSSSGPSPRVDRDTGEETDLEQADKPAAVAMRREIGREKQEDFELDKKADTGAGRHGPDAATALASKQEVMEDIRRTEAEILRGRPNNPSIFHLVALPEALPGPSSQPVAPTAQPGAYAVQSFRSHPPNAASSVHRIQDTGRQSEESNRMEDDTGDHQGLAAARPVPELDPETQHATPLDTTKQREPGYFPVLPVLLVLLVILVVGGGTLGAVCGMGRCSQGSNAPNSTVTTPITSGRDPATVTAIELAIRTMFGDGYFDDSSLLSVHDVESRQKALQWILYEDTLQVDVFDTHHLLQRFVMAHFYFFTTRYTPWTECNIPEMNSKSILCYYPANVGRGTFAPWGNKWLSGSHECRWAGITCTTMEEGQQISEVWLVSNNLNGPLSMELARLTLQKVNLEDNSLSGTVPSLYGQFPELVLTINHLEGTIPSELFSSCSGLCQRRFDHNFLTGTIPSEVGMPQLDQLRLGTNKLSGSIPKELFQSQTLTHLMIDNNIQLVGSIPTTISQMTNLQWLHIGRTATSGGMPSELGLLTNLEEVSVHNSNMHGTLPEEFFSLPKLICLDVSNNDFTGTISTSIGLATILAELHIASNRFSGTLPEEIGTLKLLTGISLNGNTFTQDTVPDHICELRAPTKRWSLVADCGDNATRMNSLLTCPRNCCTQCCDRTTQICQDL